MRNARWQDLVPVVLLLGFGVVWPDDPAVHWCMLVGAGCSLVTAIVNADLLYWQWRLERAKRQKR